MVHPRLLLVALCLLAAAATRASRVVRTRQGDLRGIVVDHPRLLGAEAYLGVPYASPPTGSFRFMPPMSPQSWSGVRSADHFKPVCPQVLPRLDNKTEALKYMTVGRYNYLKQLVPHLEKQDEDCLYLNIYSPLESTRIPGSLSPVFVFFHGESYEWNSGNPYDGSVLASYQSVVVITVNFRLGILGFLQTGPRQDSLANLGLLDQIAALLWVQENVRAFGGDPERVSLVGHGTGANLVSMLMISPVVPKGLFQRVILMSGSILTNMALVADPQAITRQVADQMDCGYDDNLARCLKTRELRELLAVRLSLPMYSIAFGPCVDGRVIPPQPHEEHMIKAFKKYEAVIGVTQMESIHIFPANIVTYGVSERDKEELILTYLKTVYAPNEEQVLQMVLNEYLFNSYSTGPSSTDLENRDALLEIFSDARIVAPVVATAQLHANAASRGTYFYVFEHSTRHGYFPQLYGSVHGEELAYALGMPLVGGSFHMRHNYTHQEVVLSEIIMNYWFNFAATGNVSSFSSLNSLIYGPGEKHFDELAPTWPPYEVNAQLYMNFGEEVTVNSLYRSHKLGLWNNKLLDFAERLDSFQPEDGGKSNRAVMPNLKNSHDYEVILDPGEEGDSGVNGDSAGGGAEMTPTSDLGLPTELAGIPLQLLLLAGLLLLLVNVCACGCVVYQRWRVREREQHLDQRIKRLSDAGMLTLHDQRALYRERNEDGCLLGNHQDPLRHGDPDLEPPSPPPPNLFYDIPVVPAQCNEYNPYSKSIPNLVTSECSQCEYQQRQQQQIPPPPRAVSPLSEFRSMHDMELLPKQGVDTLFVQGSLQDPMYAYDDTSMQSQSTAPRKFNLPRVLPDLPAMTLLKEKHDSLMRRRKSRSPPPAPIIQMLPVSEYEKLYPPPSAAPSTTPQYSSNTFSKYTSPTTTLGTAETSLLPQSAMMAPEDLCQESAAAARKSYLERSNTFPKLPPAAAAAAGGAAAADGLTASAALATASVEAKSSLPSTPTSSDPSAIMVPGPPMVRGPLGEYHLRNREGEKSPK